MLQTLHHISSLYHSVSHLNNTFADVHDEMSGASHYARASETVDFLRDKVPVNLSHPRAAIVCGSGLGGLADLVNEDESCEYDYKDLPNFPMSTVPGHEGKLIFGTMSAQRVPVLLLKGRAHFYEGHDMSLVTHATRVCRLLGVETLLLTNAAGGLDPAYSIGDIVCLNDHLNLAGLVGFHPLRGPNEDAFGVRFPPLSDAYDLVLRQLAHKAWRDLQQQQQTPSSRQMHEGVYAFVAGPTYETRAECRMLRLLGADVVGMSTVPEICVARHAGMRVLAFSLVTNKAVLEPTVRADAAEVQGLTRGAMDGVLSAGAANHQEVLEAGRAAAVDMQSLVLRIVAEL